MIWHVKVKSKLFLDCYSTRFCSFCHVRHQGLSHPRFCSPCCQPRCIRPGRHESLLWDPLRVAEGYICVYSYVSLFFSVLLCPCLNSSHFHAGHFFCGVRLSTLATAHLGLTDVILSRKVMPAICDRALIYPSRDIRGSQH